MTTTTTTFEKSIRYDRETRDYRGELNGELIGFFPSYHAAEVALDQVAYDLLADEQTIAADQSDAPAAEPAQPTCEARDCSLPATHTIDTTPPTHTCCFHYSEEFTGVLCPCRAAPVAATPDQPSCRGNGFGPCDQPATVGGYCSRCAAFLDKVFIAAMTDRALDTVRPAERFSITLRAEPVRAPRQVCPICNGDHHVQRCPRIWLELRRPAEVFYEAAA